MSWKLVRTLNYFSVFFFLMFSRDLDISFQLKRSGCMKRRQIVGTLFTFFNLNERREERSKHAGKHSSS